MDNRERARRVRMILMDVDGTLTDGAIILLPDGEEIKGYNVKDGLGILLAKLAGLKMGIITGKTSRSVEKRAERLRLDVVVQGSLDKKASLEAILDAHGLQSDEVAYIGDDIGDVDVMRAVGLAAAVADAHPLVLENAQFVCTLEGGRGAVREFIEFVLDAQGKWGEWGTMLENLPSLKK